MGAIFDVLFKKEVEDTIKLFDTYNSISDSKYMEKTTLIKSKIEEKNKSCQHDKSSKLYKFAKMLNEKQEVSHLINSEIITTLIELFPFPAVVYNESYKPLIYNQLFLDFNNLDFTVIKQYNIKKDMFDPNGYKALRPNETRTIKDDNNKEIFTYYKKGIIIRENKPTLIKTYLLCESNDSNFHLLSTLHNLKHFG